MSGLRPRGAIGATALVLVFVCDVACTRVNPAFHASSSGTGDDTVDAESGSEDGGCACEMVEPCADEEALLSWEAVGLGCEARPVYQPARLSGDGAIKILAGLGEGGFYDPTQGSKLLAMGTGLIDTLVDPAIDCVAMSTNFGEAFALGLELPPPINPVDVEGDCESDPSLIGSGDCSNTIQTQFTYNAFDYAEVRFSAEAPQGADGVELDFAFLTSEYPLFIGSAFNDMFIIWLESEHWTGNTAFDSDGNAIAVDSVKLDYMDDTLDHPAFTGTCMVGHGGTAWLTASGPVEPGEEITMVVAIWDGRDAIYDAFALVDGFRWVCGACG